MQKLLVALAALTLVSCDDTPAGRPTVAADLLWSLAPEGARGGIVMSPYAIAMIETGSVTLRAFMEKAGAEMDAVEEQLDELLAPFGGHNAKLADLGLSPDKGGALFFVKDGMVAVLPIADRDAFLAKANGTKSPTPDGVDRISTAACKLVNKHYTCATSEALLATVGKGTLKAQLGKAGVRGDIELVGAELPLAGDANPKSTVVAVAQLERGALVMRGLVINPPAELVEKLGPPVRPRTSIGRSAGFGVIDLRPMFAEAPPLPLVEGVTLADVAKTMAGPLTISVPAAETTIDMELPLTDPAPAQKVLAKCNEVAPLAQLGAKLVDGVCRISVEEAQLVLDVWVEGNMLRIGKQGDKLAGKSLPMPPVAIEIATGQWGFAFWGRGSMFAPTGKTTPNDIQGINPRDTTAVRIMSLVNEAGFAARKDTTKDGDTLRFVMTLRTSFANADAIVAKLIEITALDVIGNTATAKAQPIADAHKSSLFAGDFTAGQTGMLLPTTLIGAGARVVIPALMRYRGGAEPAAEAPTDQPPVQIGDGKLTTLFVTKYVSDVYPIWATKNPGKPCPASMIELARAVSEDATTDDEWGKPLVLLCGKDLPAGVKDIAIVSGGPDGKVGTADDIKSY